MRPVSGGFRGQCRAHRHSLQTPSMPAEAWASLGNRALRSSIRLGGNDRDRAAELTTLTGGGKSSERAYGSA